MRLSVTVHRRRAAIHDTVGRSIPGLSLDIVVDDMFHGHVTGVYTVHPIIEQYMTRRDKRRLAKAAQYVASMVSDVPINAVEVKWCEA